MSKPTLYYSTKCVFCRELLDLLKRVDVPVNYVDIGKESYPSNVSSVPTLLAESFTKPLVGKGVFEWVNNQVYFNKGCNNIMQSRTVRIPLNSELLKKTVESPYIKEKNMYCDIERSTNLLI